MDGSELIVRHDLGAVEVALQAQLDSGAPLSFTSRRFLIRATLGPA